MLLSTGGWAAIIFAVIGNEGDVEDVLVIDVREVDREV